MAVELRYVFRPLPGASFNDIKKSSGPVIELWRKHEADVNLWMAETGEQGDWVFSARFANIDTYGKCLNRITQDPEYTEWQRFAQAHPLKQSTLHMD